MLKKVISVLLSTLLLCNFITGFADETQIAVYLNNDFYGRNSMRIDGDILSVGGDVRFDGAGGNIVNGDISLSTGKHYIEENQYSKPKVSGEVIQKDGLEFPYESKKIIDLPMIANVVNSYTAGWWPAPEVVVADTYYKQLIVKSTLTVNTENSDVYILVDKLDLDNNGHINVVGKGNLYLFLTEGLELKGSAAINENGINKNVTVIMNGNLNISGNAKVNANVYSQSENFSVKNSGTLNGTIFSDAKKINISDASKIYGTVFAPDAAVSMTSGASIKGMLIAESLEISGNSKIVYDAHYTDIQVPTVIQKYILEINKNINEAGTVIPERNEYQYGEKATISVEANDGYTFEGFENEEDALDIPQNGVYIVKKNTVLKAVFAKETKEEQVPNYSGVLIPNNKPNTGNKENRLDNDGAYIYGYTDTLVAPNNSILRSEAAALMHRLLKQNNLLDGFNKPAKASFSDISKNDWYYTALEYLTYIGVYNADGVEYIFPYAEITRGEAAKLFVFSIGLEITDNEQEYEDLIKGEPFYDYINTLAVNGYLKGDGDDCVRPKDTITRAEFIAIYNRIIGRDDSYDYTTTVNGETVACQFTDISPDDWYYADVLRATNSFENHKVNNKNRHDRNDLDEY